VPVLGMAIILLCAIWWYIQVVLFKGIENSFNAKFGTHEEDLANALKDSEEELVGRKIHKKSNDFNCQETTNAN
jgi:hypothetical protein